MHPLLQIFISKCTNINTNTFVPFKLFTSPIIIPLLNPHSQPQSHRLLPIIPIRASVDIFETTRRNVEHLPSKIQTHRLYKGVGIRWRNIYKYLDKMNNVRVLNLEQGQRLRCWMVYFGFANELFRSTQWENISRRENQKDRASLVGIPVNELL